MKMIERFSGIFLFAGLLLFSFAVLSLGIIPALMVDRLHPRQGLPTVVPHEMKEWYSTVDVYQKALLRGRDLYVREACWHCHSQYVRPVSNESAYYGPVATPGEYQTVLHLPQLLGTRRAGPDLSREAGRHSNDWHLAHLYQPTWVVPESIMPTYTWYFERDASGVIQPKDDAKALVAYLQSLGKDFEDAQYVVEPEDIMLPPGE
ncbi:MAG: cbb3-type cytochrome c oxidase subunit II [Bdellovibrionota bacterium]